MSHKHTILLALKATGAAPQYDALCEFEAAVERALEAERMDTAAQCAVIAEQTHQWETAGAFVAAKIRAAHGIQKARDTP